MRDTWLGHPRGLSTLFFTEMWERFSYYGMRSILLLFMVAPAAAGGMGLSTPTAASIYGFYTMAVYALSIPGGWVADRFLGHYRAVFIGGVLITLGHFSMAVPTAATFFLGLVLIVFGTGLLKPNVSTLVGSLYAQEDHRRDAGFSLFYMGINLGAMIAPLVCGWLGQRVDWHLGFGAAGVGMVLGLTQYVIGRKHVPRPTTGQRDNPTVVPAIPLTKDDWRRIGLIFVLFVFALVFWAGYEQAGSTLTLFADRHTRLSILGFDFPSSWFQSLPALFVIVLAPVFAWLWVRLGRREPSGLVKFALGLLLLSSGFLLLLPAARAAAGGARVSPLWLTGLYLMHVLGELCLSPVGLSLVTKLSPKRIVGMMMGLWFLAAAIGNFFAGWIAGFADAYPLYQIFGVVCAITAVAAVILFLISKPVHARVPAIALLALVFLLGCPRPAERTTSASGDIVVGEYGSLTGTEATFGKSTHEGIILAVEEINAAGGIHGRKVRVVTEDDQSKTEEAPNAVTKLIARDDVIAILGEVASSSSLAAAPICQESKVPMITPSSTNPGVTQKGDYIFRMCFIDTYQGPVLARFVARDLKLKRAAMLTDVRSDYSRGLGDAFRTVFAEEGGQVLMTQSYAKGDADFRSQLTAIKSVNPELIFVPGYYNDVGAIAIQARDLGITVPLVGGDGWESPRLLEIGGKSLEGCLYANHYHADDPAPAVREFVQKYERRFGARPDSLAALGYDSMRVLADAMRRAGPKLDRAAIRDAIAATKDFSVVTGTITYNAERNPVGKRVIIEEIRNGKLELRKTIEP